MILHVDMDAFYASIEQRENPALIGKPLVVGGSADGRGVVAAASYEARKFGIHSAMSARRAKQLCPSAIFIKPRIDFYASISKQIRNIFEQYTPLVEPISLDEAFLDVTGTERLLGPALQMGRNIKQQIRNELGLIASVGVAPNKFLAKIASDLEKPDAFVVVEANQIRSFLDPLPVGRIWGVGKVSAESLRRISVTTIGQLRQLPKETLTNLFGSSGEHYWNLAQGIDPRKVIPDREAKSISSETTFAADISELDSLKAWLVILVEQVARRLRNHDRRGRTVELKVRFSDFKSIMRSFTLSQSTNVTNELLQAGLEMLCNRIPEKRLPVRLLGFGVSNFDQTGLTQMQLFDEADRETQRSLDSATDEIAKKFGKGAIHRAAKYEIATTKTKKED